MKVCGRLYVVLLALLWNALLNALMAYKCHSWPTSSLLKGFWYISGWKELTCNYSNGILHFSEIIHYFFAVLQTAFVACLTHAVSWKQNHSHKQKKSSIRPNFCVYCTALIKVTKASLHLHIQLKHIYVLLFCCVGWFFPPWYIL